MNKYFISHMQRRIANGSIGPSTLRGMGPKGTIEKARNYLDELDLRDFRVRSGKQFRDALDWHTSSMKKRLPKGARHWGVARKSLNIFLRGTNYNRFLCEKYNLYKIEQWLELPLDSHVAKGLRLEPEGKDLKRWKGVIHLEPDVNEKYQNVATQVAKRFGIYRIHLDLIYWRGSHMDNQRPQQTA